MTAATTTTAIEQAREYRAAFFAEFEEWPIEGEVGDWDADAWGESLDVISGGEDVSQEDHDRLRSIWTEAFFRADASEIDPRADGATKDRIVQVIESEVRAIRRASEDEGDDLVYWGAWPGRRDERAGPANVDDCAATIGAGRPAAYVGVDGHVTLVRETATDDETRRVVRGCFLDRE